MYTVTVLRGSASASYDDMAPVQCVAGKPCVTVADQTVVTITLPAGTDERFVDPPSCSQLRNLTCAITVAGGDATVTVGLT
jgi:hypothetical protein